MENINALSLKEVADIFCLSEPEFMQFLHERELNLNPIEINGSLYFSTKSVQAHLRSQYFH